MVDAPAPTPDNEQQPVNTELSNSVQADPSEEQLVSETSEAPSTADTAVTQPAAETVEPVVLEADTSLSSVSEDAGTTAEAAAPAASVAAEPVAAPIADTPTVASTLEVPASTKAAEPTADQEGGEWELLLGKVRHWISSGQLQEQWQTLRTPLSLLAGLIAVLLVLRVYSALLGVLDSIPLLPGLLELAGLIAVAQFSLTRLVRSDDRREVIGGLRQRWQSFRGRS